MLPRECSAEVASDHELNLYEDIPDHIELEGYRVERTGSQEQRRNVLRGFTGLSTKRRQKYSEKKFMYIMFSIT